MQNYSAQFSTHPEDLTKLLLDWLRNPNHGNYSSYGYDIYLPNLA